VRSVTQSYVSARLSLPIKIDKHFDRSAICVDGRQRIANRAKTAFTKGRGGGLAARGEQG